MKLCGKMESIWTFTVMLFLIAGARCSAQQADPLIMKMAANERQTLTKLGQYSPMVETYLQLVDKTGEKPVEDRYFLHRINLGKTIRETMYDEPGKRESRLAETLKLVPLAFHRAPLAFEPDGFMDMLSPDIQGIDPAKYHFAFKGNEFLGSLRTWVYDVMPTQKTGYFRGRLWIDGDGHLVRFIGTFSSDRTKSHPRYAHFDSWRVYIPDVGWLPAAVYIEEPLPEGILHGQVRVWGYGLKERLKNNASSVSVSVQDAVDHSDEANDVDPITAIEAWKDLATQNILDRMESAGILAPRGELDKLLDQIVVNLEVPNELNFGDSVHCRIILTTPLEATTIGNTILLSKGLIETLPNEETLASVIAFELSHLVKNESVDTRFSFADRTMFPDHEVSKVFAFSHTPKENAEAATLAVNLLRKSMYSDKLDKISLYYQQMSLDFGKLDALFRPEIGDSMISPQGKPWVLAALAGKSPKLEPGDPRQVAALPLGSNLVVDPWSGSVRLSDAPRILPRSRDENRPFAVVPVFERLRPIPSGSGAVSKSRGNLYSPAG